MTICEKKQSKNRTSQLFGRLAGPQVGQYRSELWRGRETMRGAVREGMGARPAGRRCSVGRVIVDLRHRWSAWNGRYLAGLSPSSVAGWTCLWREETPPSPLPPTPVNGFTKERPTAPGARRPRRKCLLASESARVGECDGSPGCGREAGLLFCHCSLVLVP